MSTDVGLGRMSICFLTSLEMPTRHLLDTLSRYESPKIWEGVWIKGRNLGVIIH